MNYRKYLNYAIFLAIVLVVVGLAVSHSRHMRALVDAMAGPDQAARVKAAEELVAGEQFMDSITGESVGTRVRVVQALEDWASDPNATVPDPKDSAKKLGASNAVAQLVGYLKDPDKPIRDRISAALLRVGARSDANLQEVVNGIKDGDANVRKPCVLTLQVLGQATPAAAAPLMLPEVVTRLGEPSALAATTAVFSSSYRDPAVAGHIGAKVVAIIKAEAGARGPGGDVLGQLADQREQSAALLLPLLADKDEGVRSGAADALGKVGSPSAVPALIQAMAKDTPQVRRVAIGAIAMIAAPSGEGALLEALNNPDDDNEARAQAATGLGHIATPTALDALIKALGDYDLKVQVAAVSALARVGEPAVPRLLALVNSGSGALKIRAAQALGGIKTPAGNGALTSVLQSAQPTEVRVAAATALGFAGNRGAVEPLVRALADKDGAVAAASADALAQIGAPARPALARAAASSNATEAYFGSRALGGVSSQGESAE